MSFIGLRCRAEQADESLAEKLTTGHQDCWRVFLPCLLRCKDTEREDVMRIQSLILGLILGAIAGCSSVSSGPATQPADGLIYYMPKKDIRVTVVRDAGKTTVTVGATSAYADYEKPFSLNYEKSLLARTELKVGISTMGLLTSTKSVTTPAVGDALKNLASSLGAMKALSAPPTVVDKCPDGTFTHIYSLPVDRKADDNPCGLKVDITSLFTAAKGDASTLNQSGGIGHGASGVFYRQERPYLVHVFDAAGKGVNTSEIVLSPSESSVHFLPVARTAFAVNTADFAFTDGVPTKFDQDSDGEIVAALKIPADVIGAYFAAIGKVFGDRKDVSEKEASALVAQTQLDLARQKFTECLDAIKKKDDVLIQSLGCGK